MQRIIITTLVLQSALISAGDDGRNFIGKKGMQKAKELVENTLANAPKVAGEAGNEFGKNVVKGVVSESGNQLNNGKEYLLAAGAAVLATPYAPYVLAAAGTVMAAGTTVKLTMDYRDWRFRRCLNTHFAEALNEKGFPQRCESPERRLSWWSPEMSTKSIEHYRSQRRLTQKITKGATGN